MYLKGHRKRCLSKRFKEVTDISKLEVLVCVLTVIAIVTIIVNIHDYAIMGAINRIEDKIDSTRAVSMKNRDVMLKASHEIDLNYNEIVEGLHRLLEREENDDRSEGGD